MPKTQPAELTDLITPDLITYLGDGVLNPDQLARSIDYSGLAIEEFDRLKKLHFVLHDDVVDYVEALPHRLRRIKTEHRQIEEHANGEIRGRINWPHTLERRANVGYNDRTLFVVDNPEIEVDIPENRVVKKLLALISQPLSEDIETIDQGWRETWDDADIVALQGTLAHNVYLDALPAPDEIRVTDRDLTTARRARQPLYIEGAELYRLYDDLMNDRFHRPGVQELLRETIITPTQDHKLFELFCVFGLIRRLQALYEGLQLRRIQPNSDEIAVLEDESRRVEVYYDEGGPLSFFEAFPRPDNLEGFDVPEMMHRQAEALADHERLVREFLSRGSQHTFYSGRPDFVVLHWTGTDTHQELNDVILGEIKYTRAATTFSEGLRELLEYLYFAKMADEYLFANPIESDALYGVICTDGVPTTVNSIDQIFHWDTALLRQTF